MTPELSAYAGLTTDENSPLNRKREGGGAACHVEPLFSYSQWYYFNGNCDPSSS